MAIIPKSVSPAKPRPRWRSFKVATSPDEDGGCIIVEGRGVTLRDAIAQAELEIRALAEGGCDPDDRYIIERDEVIRRVRVREILNGSPTGD